MLSEIKNKMETARNNLNSIGYAVKEVSAKEFYDFMTGEIFSEDTTTLNQVLRNDYLMIHELVEISELKNMGKTIDKRVIVESPKTVIYEAHLTAIEKELEYALCKGDYAWVEIRLKQHRESVLEDDPNLPQKMRPRAQAIFQKFKAKLNTQTHSKDSVRQTKT